MCLLFLPEYDGDLFDNLLKYEQNDKYQSVQNWQ